ncbi:MAG: ATP12 family chaperone protein [Rhizomicrobium sp.]
MKRFYKSVSVGDGNAVFLGGRTLRTPRGASLDLPARALAEAIAEEWRVQGDEIDPQAMPLTKLANTAVDGVGPRREEVTAEIAGFAKTRSPLLPHRRTCGACTPPKRGLGPNSRLGGGTLWRAADRGDRHHLRRATRNQHYGA